MHSIIATWPIIMLRGVLALALALFAYSAQGSSKLEVFEILSAAFIVFALCAYGVFDGILLLWISLRWPTGVLKQFGLTQGIGSIILGMVLATILFVKVSTAWFVILAVIQCWLMGFNELSVALHLRRHRMDRRGFFTAAAISLVFGFLALATSDGTAYVAAIWLTWYGGLMALTHFWIAYRLRALGREVKHRAATAA